MTQIHESSTEVLLTKDAVIGGGEDIVARFRLWLDADAAARLLTAAKTGLVLYVTDQRKDRNTRWTYEGGTEKGDVVMPPPQVRTLPEHLVRVGKDFATVSKADHNFRVELADGRVFWVWTYPDDSAERIRGIRVTAKGKVPYTLWKDGGTQSPLAVEILAAVEARKAVVA